MIALAIALIAATAVVLLGAPADAAVDRWRVRRRAAAFGLSAAALRSDAAPGSTAAPILRRGGHAGDAWALRRLPAAGWLQARLLRAGEPCSLTAALAASALGGGLLIAAAIMLGTPPLLAIPGGAMAMAVAVTMATGMAIRRRQAAFTRGFPDAVALIIRSLRAGLPVAASITEAGRGTTGPVADVFARVAEAMRLGQPLETALWAAAERLRLPDFDFLVVTIALQRETGGNLAETLAGLDDTLRMRRQLALKVRAMAAEARASAMIIGSLPFAMAALLWATSPEYLAPLFTTAMGRALIGAGLLSMAIGAAIISQMMQVEA